MSKANPNPTHLSALINYIHVSPFYSYIKKKPHNTTDGKLIKLREWWLLWADAGWGIGLPRHIDHLFWDSNPAW